MTHLKKCLNIYFIFILKVLFFIFLDWSAGGREKQHYLLFAKLTKFQYSDSEDRLMKAAVQ